jgi:MinD superfamily P-loop ATPase
MLKPQIDREKCDGCGLCVAVCLKQALEVVDNVVVFVEEVDCDWCTHCEVVCATGAISCPYEIIFE